MLSVAFGLAFLAVLLQGLMVPALPILAFAPYLALVVLRSPSLLRALWLAALAGGVMDLLSDDPMGLHALNYTLTTAVFLRFRRPLETDHPFHLSLLTALLSSLSTLLQLFLLFLFDRRVPFGGKWLFSECVAMPLIDALYAFVWFAAPLALIEWLRRTWVLFWLKRKNLSQSSR